MSVNGITVPPDVHPVRLIDSPWNGIWVQDATSKVLELAPTVVRVAPVGSLMLQFPPANAVTLYAAIQLVICAASASIAVREVKCIAKIWKRII